MTDKVEIIVEDNREDPKQSISDAEVKDNVRIVLTNVETGEVVHDETIHNVLTTSGKNGIADQLLAAPTLGKPTHMAIGTGAPAANALGAEVARVALTSKTRNTNVVSMVGDFAAGTGTAALTEEGVFDAGAAGNMYVSSNFAAVNKDANMSLSITHTITIN